MNNLLGKRILIAGATGFIGANLTRVLMQRGANVHALIRSQSNLWRIADVVPPVVVHRADLNDFATVKQVVKLVSPEIIYHLAAPGGHPQQPDKRADMLKTVVLGTNNLLEAAAGIDYQRFIYMCSSTTYGRNQHPHKESNTLNPVTFRGAAKAAAAILCQQHARCYGRPIVVLRPFSVYGYWESATRLIPTVILAALQNQEMRLTAPGFCRDLIFVPDVVEACLLTLQTNHVVGEVINIGSGKQWSNEEVVDWVQTLSGRQIKVHKGAYPAQPPDTTHWVANIQKAQELLGWQPQHSLQNGLEKTIAWFRQNQYKYQR